MSFLGLCRIDALSIFKRGDLDLSGIYVLTVTDRQVYQIEELDKVARWLASRMGKRTQIKHPEVYLAFLCF